MPATRHLRRLPFVVALLAMQLLGATAATAEQQSLCGERDALVVVLALEHGEALTGRGLVADTALFEIWHSAESGSWTILRTSADGITCVMAAGTHWMPGGPAPVDGTPG